ncbi:MAG: DNA repair protein RecN [Sphingobacteriales bacterium UTBCD1]|jgi:DNA repair protein RecN (Recombination protein N)|nr:MAG: DNA repair protein RecN [Sphingobacteriales bacterium UTBCD1]
MLQQLSIQNYAIIDELTIDFSPKLNIITGETGAGKSIIVGALALILGERADTSVLVNKNKKCVVEGLFSVKDKKEVKRFLEKNDPDSYQDDSDELIIRREIGVNGKSRAFINDTPVTLDLLQQLSDLLVDLHQQFDSLQLGESDFQREILDALAGHADLVNEYRKIFRQWMETKKEAEELKTRKQQFDKEADYNRFQFKELEEAALRENELENIDAQLKIMNNAEGIKTVLTKVYFDLEEGDAPLVQQLKILSNQLLPFSFFHPDMAALIQRIQSAQIELQDIAGEAGRISDHINYDPEKIQLLNDRLSAGYKLLKKHGAKTTNDLLVIQAQLEEKLQAVLNIDESIQQKEREAGRYYDEAKKLAGKISEGRKRQIKPLEDKADKLLTQVGMPNARLKVENKVEELNPFGFDKVEFLFNANLPAGADDKNISFQPVRKIASGGELSRLMLCIKSLVAKSIDLPTMIFDEIDSGISGEAARQVGIIMKDIATKRQVICITHQPQIAGKADAHFLVYKEIVKDSVKTNIRQLTTEERITAVAKMLSGEKPTAAALENAREMLRN